MAYKTESPVGSRSKSEGEMINDGGRWSCIYIICTMSNETVFT